MKKKKEKIGTDRGSMGRDGARDFLGGKDKNDDEMKTMRTTIRKKVTESTRNRKMGCNDFKIREDENLNQK